MANSATRIGYFIVNRSSEFPMGQRRLESLCSRQNFDYEEIAGYQGELPGPGKYFDSVIPVRITPSHQRVATQIRKQVAKSQALPSRSRTRFNPSTDKIFLRLKKARLICSGVGRTPLPVKEAKQLIKTYRLKNIGSGIFAAR